MSGRSAYVRKKQGPKEPNSSKRPIVVSSVYDVEQPHSPSRRMPSASGQNGSHHLHIQQLPPVPPQGISSSYSNNSNNSASSGGSLGTTAKTSHSSSTAPKYVQTAIEKSALRSFMDSKSDRFRDKLSFRFGGNKMDDRQYRPESAMTQRADMPVYELPGSAGDTARARMVRSPDGLGVKYDNIPVGRTSRARSIDDMTPRRWLGGGRPAHPWNKMKRDPELWDPSGDTLVYFGHETQQASRPPASFRVKSQMLEETQSAFLITILREGYVYDSEFNLPPSPTSQYPTSQDSSEDLPYGTHSSRRMPSSRPLHQQEAPAVYEVYFPAPLNQSKNESLRHHMTTRNVFALLMHKSLVGFTFGQALTDLHERLDMYMPPDFDSAGMIIDYLLAKNLDDVRNDPGTAAGFLAWCESPMVRWQEGWIEAFVHCAGMHTRLASLPEWREVSYISRQLVDRASLDLQVRVRDVEDRLATFNFADMWPMTSALQPAARQSFERCQKFFIGFYAQAYRSWPPLPADDSEAWLSRSVINRLQTDVGALYELFVDREVVWDESEERSTRKWKIVSRTSDSFRADSDDLPITDIFVAFDNRHRYPHIPYPFPLQPQSQPPTAAPAKGSSSLFQKKQKPVDDRLAERRAALAYSNATNINLLGSDFVSNEFVEAFVDFEKGDYPGDVDPYHARRGRWILIYGLLQVLATLSVDTPSLRWADDLTYFVNPRLRGVPPWRAANDPPVEEASHKHSYCWKVAQKWAQPVDSPEQDSRRGQRSDNRFDSRPDEFPGPRDSGGGTTTSTLSAGSMSKPVKNMLLQDRSVLIQRKVTLEQTAVDAAGNDGLGLLAGSESDEVATVTTVSNIGGQRAKDWVNSGGGLSGPNGDTIAIRSHREKVREWPIQTLKQERQRVDGGGPSSYRPPSDW